MAIIILREGFFFAKGRRRRRRRRTVRRTISWPRFALLNLLSRGRAIFFPNMSTAACLSDLKLRLQLASAVAGCWKQLAANLQICLETVYATTKVVGLATELDYISRFLEIAYQHGVTAPQLKEALKQCHRLDLINAYLVGSASSAATDVGRVHQHTFQQQQQQRFTDATPYTIVQPQQSGVIADPTSGTLKQVIDAVCAQVNFGLELQEEAITIEAKIKLLFLCSTTRLLFSRQMIVGAHGSTELATTAVQFFDDLTLTAKQFGVVLSGVERTLADVVMAFITNVQRRCLVYTLDADQQLADRFTFVEGLRIKLQELRFEHAAIAAVVTYAEGFANKFEFMCAINHARTSASDVGVNIVLFDKLQTIFAATDADALR